MIIIRISSKHVSFRVSRYFEAYYDWCESDVINVYFDVLWILYLLEKNYLKDCLLDFSSLAPHLLNQFSLHGGCGRKPGNMNQMLPPKNGGMYFLSVILKLFLRERRVFYAHIHYLQVCMAIAAGVESILPWTIISKDFTDYSAIPLWFWLRKKKKVKLVTTLEVKQCWKKILQGFLVINFSRYIDWASVSFHKSSSTISLWINTPCPAIDCCCLQPWMNLWKECCNYKLLFLGQLFWGNLNKIIILELNCSPKRSMSYPFKTGQFCSIFLHIFAKG